ncbi:bifunctional 4-hydroxy-2-oxoglutarate aldolase/2-dehydro-3-deoxy-phosphogluconate aldolase [Rugosimonospora acidiphila]
MSTVELRRLLVEHRLIGILRGDDHEAALRSIQTVARAGISLIEVSLTGRDALALIARARRELGDEVLVGAGTVLTADEAEGAVAAGAAFALTPALGPGVDACVALGLPVVAGAYTPSEVVGAGLAGAAAVKLFPASQGGVDYLRALRAPFPHVDFVPVGGVAAEHTTEYLAAGAVAVGVGGPLFGDALRGGDQVALAQRARAFRRAAGFDEAVNG